jgi:hypothetical protein
MPRGNGRGPDGRGPMSGRGAGYCAGYGMPGYANNVGGMGRGMRRGFGGGMGWGGPAFPVAPFAGATPPAEVEKWNLERRAEALEEELKMIRERMEAMAKA